MKKIINKLVRDKIIDINIKNGLKQEFRYESGKILETRFFEKIIEETEELKNAETREEKASEIADLFDILTFLAKKYGISLKEIEKFRKAKLKERGSFEKGVFLISTGE